MASLARPPSPALPMWKRFGNSTSSTDRRPPPRSSDRRRSVRCPRRGRPARCCPTPAFRENGCPCGATRAASAAIRSGSQVEVQSTILPVPRRRHQRLLDHLLDLIGAEHREHDDAAGRHVGERGRGIAAHRLELGILRRIDVVADHAGNPPGRAAPPAPAPSGRARSARPLFPPPPFPLLASNPCPPCRRSSDFSTRRGLAPSHR